jgi:hypothetical protein
MEGGLDALFFRMLAQFRAITALRDGDHGKYLPSFIEPSGRF